MASTSDSSGRPDTIRKCDHCVRWAAMWATAKNGMVFDPMQGKDVRILPPPSGCSDCAELNGWGGGLFGALRHGTMNGQVAEVPPAETRH